MDSASVPTRLELLAGPSLAIRMPWLGVLCDRMIERPALVLAIAAIPISIAATEALLAIAIVFRLARFLRGQARGSVPRIFWVWLGLATAQVLSWLFSPSLGDAWSELRHLLLVGGLFFVLPALDGAAQPVTAWKAVFLSSSLGSLFLIGDFVTRLIYYRREIAGGDDASFLLRTGGLLNNWMVYGTVEILIVAGLVSFWFAYPDERRRWWPVVALNGAAIVLSLTRTVWVACFLLLAVELVWKRSRWLLALPLLPLGLYLAAPAAVRSRINVSTQLDYFSNAERLQMARVGWEMIRKHPWTGVGPGRIDKLYRSYLAPSDSVPVYHGHLHNNLIQMAAQFGIPVALIAILFAVFLFYELARAYRKAQGREDKFLSHAALLALIGFLVAGCFDYTYGHSLALILLCFAVIYPLLSSRAKVLLLAGESSA